MITKPSNGGEPCPDLNETRTCNMDPCPIDCIVGPFRKDGDCSVTCGSGYQPYIRDILQKPGLGGKECPELNKTEVCVEVPCPRNCSVSGFVAVGACNVTCGGGIRLYRRTVVVKPSNGGHCPHLEEYRSCNELPCPIDGRS